MQINLNRKKPFFFCRKIKETSLSIKRLTSSAYHIKEHRKENPPPPPPSFLIDNEDITTIKTNHQPSSSSSSLSSFMFPSPTLTATTLQKYNRNGNEDVSETGDDEEEDVKEFDHLKSANGLYSNFYLKLPNGKWLVKVRTRERKILGMYELDASMI
ncbi:hypothetical protein BJ944DRAFT_259432 [Cunninghamella echinulata]|nr:hypothetical protein BJ944DRAFT_259432 [Cunninghamella echinulata]